MYLGEISRNVLLSLVDAAPKPLLFNGKSTSAFNVHYGLDTSFMSDVERAWSGDNEVEEEFVPAFNSFNADDLSLSIKERLERVRKVIVKELGYDLKHVSLKDAAVSFLVDSLAMMNSCCT